jgi:alpha-D-ribose 1-methylphosphonate 5-triphosphate diphosphatase PhnM
LAVPEVLAGTVVTGDGSTLHAPGYVVVEDGRIAAVGPGRGPGRASRDFGDALITPGFINIHVHCVTLGPAHATGSRSPTEQEVHDFKQRHLRGGTTAVMSVDGFPLWAEYRALADRHPLKVVKCTTHTPANLRAAELADGEGLTAAHRAATVDELVGQGAAVIGEVGAGGTLGGGMQDNIYIPNAVKARSGVQIDPFQARALKEAVLGRTINPADLDRAALQRAMDAAGLVGRLPEDAVIDLVQQCVMPSMQQAYEGLREAAAASARLRRPFMVHHAAASAEVVLEVANDRLIAGHCNHPSFTVEESIDYARTLRARGALLEISGLDLFTRTKGKDDVANFLALVRERLVDVVGTDYAAGNYDPVSVPIAAIVRDGLVSIPEAVALVTGNVVRRLPGVFQGGLLEPGRPADLAIFAPDLSQTRAVYVDGRRVLSDG